MANFLTVAVVAVVGYYALRMFIGWKGDQAERDRQTALAIAEDQKQGAKYAMIGGVVAGTAGLVSSIFSFGFRK